MKELALRFIKHYNLPSGVEIRISSTIPAHVGLGSGTQLRLAVAAGLARFFELNLSVNELAGVMNYGESRSGIGTTVFAKGGFIVDAGLKPENFPCAGKVTDPPPVLFNKFFPEDWFVIIVIPRGEIGLNGKSEISAFKKLPPMPEENVGVICRLLVMQLLPSLIERDSSVFGAALLKIQKIIGNYFAPVQGGSFASKVSAELAEYCIKKGAFAASQSSWGPALYAFVEGEKQAERLAEDIKTNLGSHSEDKIFVTSADNKGAVICEKSD